jgi:hypothetical protein
MCAARQSFEAVAAPSQQGHLDVAEMLFSLSRIATLGAVGISSAVRSATEEV